MKSAALALLAAAAANLIPQPSAAQTVLRFNVWVPPTHHTHVKMMMPWAADVEAATQGRVSAVGGALADLLGAAASRNRT